MTRIARVMAFVLVLGACTTNTETGQSDASADTAGDTFSCTLNCVAPLLCGVDPKDGSEKCASAPGDVPTCKGTPPGQAVPFALAADQFVVHWPLKPGCIKTSYDAALAPYAAKITAAVATIAELGCSSLCLEAPVQMETVPTLPAGERRIHFHVLSKDTGGVAATQLLFELATGRMMGVSIEVDPSSASSLRQMDYLKLMAFAIGLKSSPEGTNSLTAPESPASSLTALDETAICTLYGAPGICGD